jgi:hypothetical protein
MYHTTLYNVKQPWLTFRVWPRCPDDRVNVCRVYEAVGRSEREKKVHVWKPTLLEFDTVNVAEMGPKYVVLHKLVNKRCFEQVKDADGYVGPIRRRLMWKKTACNFRPERVACECNEKIETVVITCKGDRVLETLNHVSWTTDIWRRKNDTMTDVMKIDVAFTLISSVFQSAIESSTQLRLMGFNPA